MKFHILSSICRPETPECVTQDFFKEFPRTHEVDFSNVGFRYD